MRFISSASLGGQNISSSLLTATYTATAVDAITTRLFAAGISGSASYLAFITLQRLGTGSTYQVIPVTSASVEKGTTSIALTTIPVPVDNTDVLNVYLQGSASDTAAPSLWTYFYAESTCTLLVDNALTAAAIASSAFTNAKFGAGAIGVGILGASALAASNIGGSAFDSTVHKTGAITVGVLGASVVGASNIGGSAFDSTVFKTGAIPVGVLGASAIAASNISGSAFDSTVFKTSAIDAAAIAPSAITSSEFAQSAADEVWASATRTLTQSATSIAAAVSGSRLSIHRGDSWSAAITGLGDISGRSKFWFTAKEGLDDVDTIAVLMISEGSGLHYFNKSAAASAAQGALTVDNATSGNITITLDEVYTASLNLKRGHFYDIQMLNTSGSVSTLSEGRLDVTLDVTRAVS